MQLPIKADAQKNKGPCPSKACTPSPSFTLSLSLAF